MTEDLQSLNYEQAAARMGVSEDRLRELRRERRIRDYPGYAGWTFRAEEIDALAAELAQEQAAVSEEAAATEAADVQTPEEDQESDAGGLAVDRQQQVPDVPDLQNEEPRTVDDIGNLVFSVDTASPPVSESERSSPAIVEEFISKDQQKQEKREWKEWRRKWVKRCPVERRGQFGQYINRNFRQNYRTISGDLVKLFESRDPHPSQKQKHQRVRSESGTGCAGVVLFLLIGLAGLVLLFGSQSARAAEPSPPHWAFRPIHRPVVPPGSAVHPVDRFLDQELQEAGLVAAPPAPRSTLVRRLSLDVLGLLPGPERVKRFQKDERPDAWERLVDELLASPHFGERFGRHWLDLARYADSSGYESDSPRQIWPYRDWVINALNDDMPFDRFVTEQLAGDLLPDATVSQKIATGFHCNAMLDGGVRWEAVIDRVQTTGAVFLGLTLGCAQCHAHKTDPVSHREFYELYAFFNESTVDRLSLPGFDAGYRDGTIKAPETDKKSATEPEGPATLVLRAAPQPTHVFQQGDPRQPGDKVEPGFPSFLSVGIKQHDGSGARRLSRLDLARWVISDDNPLPDRVTVNRIWQRLFGTGLVETENDFGVQTPPPTHPGLLDFLAIEFRRGDRSLKRLIRLLVTSAAYRRSSEHVPELQRRDPRNRLVGRQRRLRLEAEIVRDVWLSAAGLLSSRMNGPSVFPRQPAGILDARATPAKWTASTGENLYRRGLYTWTWRLTPHPLLPLFDAPDGVTACTCRDRSNVPVQALTLLNDPAFVECSQALAMRLATSPVAGDVERIRQAYQTCFSREASVEEVRLVRVLLDNQRRSLETQIDECRQLVGRLASSPVRPDTLVDLAAWVVVARVLMNLDEFITRE